VGREKERAPAQNCSHHHHHHHKENSAWVTVWKMEESGEASSRGAVSLVEDGLKGDTESEDENGGPEDDGLENKLQRLNLMLQQAAVYSQFISQRIRIPGIIQPESAQLAKGDCTPTTSYGGQQGKKIKSKSKRNHPEQLEEEDEGGATEVLHHSHLGLVRFSTAPFLGWTSRGMTLSKVKRRGKRQTR